MRALVLLATICVAPVAMAQTAGSEEGQRNLFTQVKPEATVVIQTTKDGGSLVNVTMLDAKYPPEVLQKQLAGLSRALGVEPRGLQVVKHVLREEEPRLEFWKAQLGTNNLVDRERGIFRLQPIARAFAGAPKGHEIDAISVIFAEETPTAQTVRSFRSPAVEVQAQAQSSPRAIEYRVVLNTQDPEKIVIPETVESEKPSAPKPAPAESNVTLWVLFGVAAVAVGALVYSLLLRARPQARRKPER